MAVTVRGTLDLRPRCGLEETEIKLKSECMLISIVVLLLALIPSSRQYVFDGVRVFYTIADSQREVFDFMGV